MGVWDNFGARGEDIWWERTSVLRIVRFQTSLVQICRAVYYSILYGYIAICHRRKSGQVWGSQLPYQKSQVLRLPQGNIAIIIRFNPWAVRWLLEGTF